jgi:hypothetical protein
MGKNCVGAYFTNCEVPNETTASFFRERAARGGKKQAEMLSWNNASVVSGFTSAALADFGRTCANAKTRLNITSCMASSSGHFAIAKLPDTVRGTFQSILLDANCGGK